MKNVGEFIFILLVTLAVVGVLLIVGTAGINYILGVFGDYEFTACHTAVFVAILGVLRYFTEPKRK